MAYPTALLEHYRAPQHRERPTGASSGHARNPLCGDEITFHARRDGARIVAAGFDGVGCAISLGAADLLAAHLLAGGAMPASVADMERLVGMEVPQGRRRCLSLPMEAAQAACPEGNDKGHGFDA